MKIMNMRMMGGVLSGLLLGAVGARSADIRQDGDGGAMVAVVSRFVGVYTTPPEAAFRAIPDAPLLGNGNLTVAVGGSYTSQTFHLTKSDLCLGNRAAGQVRLQVEGVPATPEQYRQEQDLLRAEVRSTLPFAEGALRIRSWTADSDDILVSELTLEKGAALNVAVELKADKGAGFRDGVAWVCRERPKGRAGIACRILGAASQAATSSVDAATIRFTLRSGQPLRLVTVVAGGTTTPQATEAALAKAAGLTEESLVALHREHLAWWNRYWSKSWIELNDELLEKYYYGALYVMGCASRSNGIAPGLAGAWHVLGGGLTCGNDYTMDYNFEAPWWGVYTCNRAELADPHDRVLFESLPATRKRAARHGAKGLLMSGHLDPTAEEDGGLLMGMKGNAALAAMNLLSRYEYTQDDAFLLKAWPYLNDLAAFWEDNLSWDAIGQRWVIAHSNCREDWDFSPMSFGSDTNPISDLSYVRRFLGFLLRVSDRLEGQESAEGKVVIAKDRKQKWRDYLDKLSPAPTTVFRGRVVFREAESGSYITSASDRFCLLGPGDNADVLMGVFPGEAVGPGSDPRLLQIARHTAEAMNANTNDMSWFQANNFPKIFTQAVRAGGPAEEVVARLRQRLAGRPGARQGVLDAEERVMNNFAINPKYHGLEAVGALEAINSMLLQSANYVIRVFPVWLKDRDARFTNLRAKGAFLVSSEYKQGAVGYVELVSEAGQPVTLENPWPGVTPEVRELTTGKPEKVRARFDGRQLAFETRKGSRYRVQPGARHFAVSAQHEEGDEVWVTIEGLRTAEAVLPNPWPLYGVKALALQDETTTPVAVKEEAGLLRFPVKAGGVYKLIRRNQLAQVELKAEPRRCSTVTSVRLSVASGRMSDGTVAPIERARLVFASENERIATVDASGVVTCRKPGVVVLSVRATLDDAAVTGGLKLNVQPHQLQRVDVRPEKEVFVPGRSVRFLVRGEMTDGSEAKLGTARIAYASSDERIATIAADGVARFVGEGRATITATVTLAGTCVSSTFDLNVTRESIIQQVCVTDAGSGCPNRRVEGFGLSDRAGCMCTGSRCPNRLVDGSGLSGLSLGATHDAGRNTMWLRPVSGPADASLRFDLGMAYKLDELWVWNFNIGSAETRRGLRNVAIYHSLDGQTWTELKGPGYPYEFAPADGKPGQQATNLNDGQHTPVRFGGVAARYVKLVADPRPGVGSWGEESHYGLSEVMFTEQEE